MNPELFIEQSERVPLSQVLMKFATEVNVASDRQDTLKVAGIDDVFLSGLRCDTKPFIFAQSLVGAIAKWKQWDYRQWDYHPMVRLLEYLRDSAPFYGLAPQDVALFGKLVERGKENLKALAARNAVGRIESPQQQAIGTGVLVGKDVLLTCYHVFRTSMVKRAWVRFNYQEGGYNELPGYLFELDLDFLRSSDRPDYALVRIKREPSQRVVEPVSALLDEGQEIRLIHHPRGEYVAISEVGQIARVGEDYIDHNINSYEGSSGGPIFDREWQLVAINRGNPGIGRQIEPGTLEAIPIRAISNSISEYLA